MSLSAQDAISAQIDYIGRAAEGLLWSPASSLSIWVIGFAMLIAASWICITRRHLPSLRYLRRILLPKSYLTGRSAVADWIMLAVSYLVLPVTWIATIFSTVVISGSLVELLASASGKAAVLDVSPETGRAITTLVAFLAYELMYWFDHWLMHRVPFLWEFHKVHHSAETLSPVTTYRMHPVDGYLYFALNSLALGGSIGLCLWLFGPQATPLTIDGTNLILLLGSYLIVTLQHSHIWIPFRGDLGRFILSPAHHQIHHSADPKHFGTNLGNLLAIWDVLFGTLHEPSRRSPNLRFGVDGLNHDPHSLFGLYFAPFGDAAKHIKRNHPGEIATADEEKGQFQPQ
ncbi:MAG: sterol desaturase family protein [Sphingomonadaceae bacterium]|nr:sterol desaturase family protein [Sphingomonadaceae bacterium]